MAIEIERKFLLNGDSWRRHVVQQESLRQAYLNRAETCSVRVRIQGDAAFLNIKQAVAGSARLEFEYGIPMDDAVEMIERLREGPAIEKTRYRVQDGEFMWEIDVFHGDNAGLAVAEIELPSVDTEFPRPEWLGREVTDKQRYYNVSLTEHPWSRWSDEERLA